MPAPVELEQDDLTNPDCNNRVNSTSMNCESAECYSSECSSATSAAPSEEESSGSIMLNPPSPIDFENIVAELYNALIRMKDNMPQAPAPEVASLLLLWLRQGSRPGYPSTVSLRQS
ncbi:hypothetical protein M514_24286 [Trichuris suis]|nr:hypothetical protein M514_24286 [Trichuris suis]